MAARSNRPGEGAAWHAQLLMVLCAAVLYVIAAHANLWLFSNLEFTRGIHWVYLPAGVRLLCVLLFGFPGAVGLMLGSWMSTVYDAPGDGTRAFVTSTLSAAGPYLVYRAARWRYGWQRSLVALTADRLLAVAVACSLVTPLLHHLWYLSAGQAASLHSYGVMFIGDLLGTVLVLYGIRFVLLLVPPAR